MSTRSPSALADTPSDAPTPPVGAEDRAGGRGWLSRGGLALAAAIALVTGVGGAIVEGIGLPAPHLLAGLFAGLVIALWGLDRRLGLTLPRWLYVASQAVAGALLGAYFSLSALSRVGWSLVPLAAVTLLTLAISVAAGMSLSRHGRLDRPTAALGMIAGGSAGIVAAADDLDADARIVAILQYVRLVLVVATAPLLVRYLFAPMGHYGALGAKEIEIPQTLGNYAFALVVCPIGALIATRLRVPAGALIGPLILSALLVSLPPFHGAQVPEAPREVAFVVIGLAVGLGFNGRLLRRVTRLAPLAFAYIVGIVVICGLLAVALAALPGLHMTDTYLATTPGGINAVLVTAFAAHANISLVFGVQGLRLLLMVVAAPVLVRKLVTGRVAV
jgi:uncharacterized protein